ncbi:MAG: PAS domain S-box protein, partial [Vicinamibacterales bacterium]
TATADHARCVELLRNGAQDYVTTPLDAQELRARVNTQLAGARVRTALVREVAARTTELRQRGALMRAVVETAPDAVITIDAGGIIHSFNRAAERMFGYTAAEAVGQNVRLLMPAPLRTEHDGYLARYLDTGEARIIGKGRATVGLRKDGTTFPIDLSVSAMTGNNMFAGIIRDATERTLAEAKLRESEERYRRTLDSMLEGCQIISNDWRYLYLNDAVVAQSRTTREELLGRTMGECYPGIEQTDVFAALQRCKQTRTPCRMVTEFTFPDGSAGWFDLSIQPVPEGIFVLSADITEHKRLERRLADLQNDERRRLAHEVHDDMGGMMTGIGMLAQTLETQLAKKRSPLAARATDLVRSIEEAHLQLRGVASGLAPVESVPEGLMAALQGLAGPRTASPHTRRRFVCRAPVLIDDADTATHLFRIAQEAVTNATRHAQARHIVIALTQDALGVTLRVTDNGIGMTTKTNERGMGLHSMQARAQLLGGRVTIASRRRRGTCVTCWVPHRGPRPDASV